MVHFHYQDNGDNHDYPHMNDLNRLPRFSGRQSYIGFLIYFELPKPVTVAEGTLYPTHKKLDVWKYNRF